ncbi:MAG: AMMECR1 domain-containing protein [Egibacteraceae bacterium]
MSAVAHAPRPRLGAEEPGADAARERAELLALLRRDGILHRCEAQPVLSRDGSSARWMLDSLCVTLTPRGAELAARCLLRLLQSFEGRQLATYGLTGVPLLQGCILHGEGRYRGALVRKERKAHGSLKLIEGRLDKSEPVVLIDDSVSSGHSMWACADRLEEAGFQVEGGVCLVRFCYERGTAKLLERGYRMAAVFDIYEDFIRHMEGEAPYPPNPTREFGELPPSPRRAAERLHPAHLAREAIAEYLRTGQVLGAPAELDRAYDAAGGCWVSMRRRANVHDRPARSGFWRFPDEPEEAAEQAVVLASVRTARELLQGKRDPAQTLEECAIAVTFFSELEQCTVGDLDNDRYGIVVRSLERTPRMGGALPRMPGIANDWQQFAHAWRRNARLLPLEPYRLYRHRVEKAVEPGAAWQPTGTPAPDARPWHEDASEVGAVAARAREHVLHELGAAAVDGVAPALPPDVVGTFVTVYANGRLAGCAGGFSDDPHAALGDYAAAAVRDARFAPPEPGGDIAVSVSLLFNRHEIGVADPDWVMGPTRFAVQALEVSQADRRGLLLPSIAVTNNLTPRGYVDEVIDKAGITRPPYRWTRYNCATWLADGGGVRRLDHGLPRGEPAPSAEAQAERLHQLLLGYARRHHVVDAAPASRYEVFADRLRTGLHPARLAYGAWVKARAGLRREALDDLSRLGHTADGWICLDGQPPSISELAFVVLARVELGDGPGASPAIASRLWAQIDLHGRFVTHRDKDAAHPAYQDYAPGQALLALARAVEYGVVEPQPEPLRRALRFYRIRFRQNHHWGAVAWLPQAYAAWGSLLADAALTAFAYEVADWALQFQSRGTGAFLNDHQSDSPGATTALYLEGLAAVWAAAEAEADAAGQRRYRSACERALRFLDRLVYQERDASVLPNPDWAIGGLRTSLTSSDVRIDYVHHALSAVLSVRPRRKEL